MKETTARNLDSVAPDRSPTGRCRDGDDQARRLVAATTAGLPLCVRPYAEVARRLGLSEDDILARFSRMIDDGSVRRIAAVPNHYALGYRANGMSVWDVADEQASECGRQVGALPFVSHCYLRPRHATIWPYNLFAMVHGKSRAIVEARVLQIAALLGERQRAHEVLYSKRILKKTGLRLSGGN
jgi:DNA-binding Lrp family transcriptional regulator